jgi:hypothetical protein
MEKFARSNTWRGKSIDTFTNAELNDYYLSCYKPNALKLFGNLIYREIERIDFPSVKNTDEEQIKLLRRISNKYISILKSKGFKIKRYENKIFNGDGEHITYIIYIRETPNSTFNNIPTINKMYLNHLTKFTGIHMKKVMR